MRGRQRGPFAPTPDSQLDSLIQNAPTVACDALALARWRARPCTLTATLPARRHYAFQSKGDALFRRWGETADLLPSWAVRRQPRPRSVALGGSSRPGDLV